MQPASTDKAAQAKGQLKKPVLRLGSNHPDVGELHHLLGRYVSPFISKNKFDSLTDYLVRLFQYRMFLVEDGIVGSKTWRALYEGQPIDMPTLKLGSRSSAVALLQKVLSTAGFIAVADGIFGRNTARSLSNFQRHMGLKADAVVGASTWHALSKTRPDGSTRTLTGFTILSDQKRHTGPITDLATANLRRTPKLDYGVATASLDTTVRLWTSYGLQLGIPYVGDRGAVSTVAFHPTRKQYISGTNGGTVRVTDFPTKTNRIFPARGGGVKALAVDPVGQYIATGTSDGAVRLFDFAGDLIRELSAAIEGQNIQDMAISPRDGRLAVAKGLAGVTLWDRPLDPQGEVSRLSYAGHNETGLSGPRDEGRLSYPAANVVRFSPDGFQLAVAHGNSLKLFGQSTGNQRNLISGIKYSAAITALAFNISARYLATGCTDGNVYIQDLLRHNGILNLPFTLEGHEAPVSAVQFQGGAANTFSLQPEDLLYSADRSGRLITWSIQDNLPKAS